MTADDVLRERARHLAQPVTAPDDAPRQSLVRFRREGQRFAVTIDAVRQVVRLEGTARLPTSTWPLLAIASFGDRVVPVLDVVGTGHAGARPAAPVWGVVVMAGRQPVALAADEVLDVVAVADADITPARATDDTRSRVASGITPHGDAVVDLESLRSLVDGSDQTTASRSTTSARNPHP